MNKHTIKFEFEGHQIEIRPYLNNETWVVQAFCDNKPLLERPCTVSKENVQDAHAVESVLDPMVMSLMESLKVEIENKITKLNF